MAMWSFEAEHDGFGVESGREMLTVLGMMLSGSPLILGAEG